MAIGINDLDDDDFMAVSQDEEPVNQEPINQEPSTSQEDTFITDLLRTKGIDDPSKIKFEDDNGNIEERNWNNLSNQEKINILNTPINYSNEPELSDEEINLLQQIRDSRMTPTQYIESLTIQQEPQEPTYKIDDLSDDELYLLDLESRVGEITEEQAIQALQNAKDNEDLFKKQVEGIRKEYKEREDFQLKQQEAEIEQQQQEAFNEFQNSVVNSIDQFNTIGNLDLNFDNSDKEELAQFMLSKDETGNNYLWQALQDPDTLVRAAWFILNGEDAINNIAEYFTNQIKLVSQNQYKKGLEDGKMGTSRPSVVINNNTNKQRHTYNSINDLDDDD